MSWSSWQTQLICVISLRVHDIAGRMEGKECWSEGKVKVQRKSSWFLPCPWQLHTLLSWGTRGGWPVYNSPPVGWCGSEWKLSENRMKRVCSFQVKTITSNFQTACSVDKNKAKSSAVSQVPSVHHSITGNQRKFNTHFSITATNQFCWWSNTTFLLPHQSAEVSYIPNKTDTHANLYHLWLM